MNKVYRGEDIPLFLNVRDADGAPLEITELDDVRVAIVHEATGRSIGAFSIETSDGTEPIELSEEETGRIGLVLSSEKTAGAPEGLYQLELKVKRTTSEVQTSRIAIMKGVFSLYSTKLTNS